MQSKVAKNVKKLFEWLCSEGVLESTITDVYKITVAGRAYFKELV